MQASWSSSVYDGKKGEDRIVAVRRDWPQHAAEQQFLASISPTAADLGCASLSACCSRPTRGRLHRPSYCLFGVFDGHNGPRAARFAADNVAAVVEALLPAWAPSAADPVAPAPEVAARLQQVLILAFLELNRQFAASGRKGGCSATVALQVGRLLTVASLGSGRCMLDTGDGCGLLLLSQEHVISSNLLERQRLLAAGCRVAAMDMDTQGPARGPCRNDGVQRVWPGGLTLSRSLGDFGIGDAILPLPYIKQVMLSTSGGRLILATDSVWTSVGTTSQLQLMHSSPLKTACHKVIKAISTSRSSQVDASIIVADVLPSRLHSFRAVCKQCEEQVAAATGTPVQQQQQQRNVLGGGKMVLKTMFGRSETSRQAEVPPTAAADMLDASHLPLVCGELLADFDSAAMLGLVPRGCGETGSNPASRVGSRSSTGNSSSVASRAEAVAAMQAAMQAVQHPAWADEQTELLIRWLLGEAPKLWYKARCCQRAVQVAAVLSAAAVEEQSLMGGSVSSTGTGAVKASWLEAAAAAAAAAGGTMPAFTGPSSTPLAELAPPSQASPLAPSSPEQLAPSPSLASQQVAGDASKSGLNKHHSLPSGMDSQEDGAGTSSSMRRVSFGSTVGAALVVEASADSLATPRRHLPPLHTQPADERQGLGLASPLASGSRRWRAARAVSPGLESVPAETALADSASGSLIGRRSSSSSLTLARTSVCPLPPMSPKVSLEEVALRRRAPGELAASPGTKWTRAYSLVAGVFTKAGSGFTSRNMEAAAGVDSWTESYGSMAGNFMSRKGAHYNGP